MQKANTAIGRINAAWARNKGMSLREEWETWISLGWSTLSFGIELWPWGEHKELQAVESKYLRIALG